MDTVIGSLLDRLQGLLSKAFLLGGFIPVFIFLLINAALAYVLLPVVRDYAGYWFHLAGDHIAIFSLVIVLATFFGGIAVWSLNAWFRQFLEGQYFPGMLRSRLHKMQYGRLMRRNEEIDKLKLDLVFYRAEIADRVLQKGLRAARIEGTRLNDAKPLPAELRAEADWLRGRRSDWQSIPFADLKNYYTALEQELRTNSADVVDELDQLQTEFRELTDYGAEWIEGKYARLVSDKRMRFPDEISDIGPTLMANLSQVHREYGIRHYKLDIEFFWIRLLKIIKSDAELYPIIEETKNQLDYSVTMTILIGIATVQWIGLSYFCCDTVIPLLAVWAVGWMLSSIFYSITVQNYRSFVAAVRSALDLHRFELLKALHVGLPANSVEEKALWEQIYLWRDSDPVTFVHEDTKPPNPPNQPAKPA
jgi:hypothetical protein